MDIVTREQLSNMPNGTVFAPFSSDIFDGDIRIITGRYKDRPGFDGVVYIRPNFQWESGDPTKDSERITNWCATDETEWDYDENQFFAVFTKIEVQYMINVLMWALAGCSYPDNFSDRYVCGNCEFDEKELDEWTDNTRGLTWS